MRHPPYSAEELATLARVYPHGGIKACMVALPHRTKKSIQTRVHELQLSLTPDAKKAIMREAWVLAKRTLSGRPKSVSEERHTIMDQSAFLWAGSVFDLPMALGGGVVRRMPNATPGRVHVLEDDEAEVAA